MKVTNDGKSEVQRWGEEDEGHGCDSDGDSDGDLAWASGTSKPDIAPPQ